MRFPDRRERRGQSVVAGVGDEVVEVGEGEGGAVDRLGVVGAERLQQVPQFRQGAAGGILHSREGGAGRDGVAVEHRACGTGLHPHRRDVVGDDVVEFAGDAQPVEGDRLRRRHLALALELTCALLEGGALLGGGEGALAHVVGAAEEGGVDEELQDHEGREGREQSGLRQRLVGGVDRGAEGRDDQPHEHAGDDARAHDRGSPAIDQPRADGVEAHEDGDVADVDLGDAGGHAHEVRHGDGDRDRGGIAPPHRERGGEGERVDEAPLGAGGIAAEDPGDGVQRDAEHGGDEQSRCEPDI